MSSAPLTGRTVEPEQWLQRHPEAGSSWPSWPRFSWKGAGFPSSGLRVEIAILTVRSKRVQELGLKVWGLGFRVGIALDQSLPAPRLIF